MTALSINPTDDEIHDVAIASDPPGSWVGSARRVFQAAVEAERARAAAEATEEWGVEYGTGDFRHVNQCGSDADARGRAEKWAEERWYDKPTLVRRTAAGPWEVQS